MKNLSKGTPFGLYRPEFEHDACGVGVVANLKGLKSHDIIEKGLEVLLNLSHRGAEGSDPGTGDGAGILTQIPNDFMQREATKIGFTLPPPGQYGVGMVFLPQNSVDQEECERVIQMVIEEEGQFLLGWRTVPVNDSGIGRSAKDNQPIIRQFFVGQRDNQLAPNDLERILYIIRKQIERRIHESILEDNESFYICTLSTNKIVYKGLLLGNQVNDYYEDLKDPEYKSSFALIHSRFSTNTLGSWKLAHPYRFIVHNGEINTLRGNINWMVAREGTMESPDFGNDISKIFPVITPGASDTASIDNAIELLLQTGRPIQHVMAMLIPEATGIKTGMNQNRKDFYDYHSCMMEPWDGPALIAFTDGYRLGAILDRNGLRPFRYLVTKSDLLVMASEVGVLDIPTEEIVLKDRIYPGRLFLIDPDRGGIVSDDTLKEELSSRKPYGQWLDDNLISLDNLPEAENQTKNDPSKLTIYQQIFGYTQEEVEMLLEPMAINATEPIGSMGNDTPLAVLSDKPQLLFNFFKQLFAQVTNPPLDAIREELVTSLEITLGSRKNIFDETPQHARQLKLSSPVISNPDMDKIKELNLPGLKSITLSTLFHVSPNTGSLKIALDKLCEQASQAVQNGYNIIILSDRGVDEDKAPIPSLLAVSGVHHHLIRTGNRTKVGLVIESAEPKEVAHFALLIGYGAGAVNPYLALEVIEELAHSETLSGTKEHGTTYKQNYLKAAQKGLLKIISKMGISTIQSYRGAQILEAVGLSQSLIDEYFTWTPSRIGGIDLTAIETTILERHSQSYRFLEAGIEPHLDPGGSYYWRQNGEFHMWHPDTISKLQIASRTNDYKTYKEFARLSNETEEKSSTLRGLLSFKPGETQIPLDDVEPAEEIVKRLATGAISLGAISKEAHETLAIAMNRIGARSNSGEGGEDFRRYSPDSNGDLRHSAIKQVASGRFGVTTNYLVNASDLQIKMAQGSKPGEGGQLPGHKVDEYIGWVRNSTPGVELISPPPHHDIYSIEDLAQLIHDLKNVNPEARVHVKLVSEVGVGTIAAGVSKAHADVVLISGDSGGTGASPESSVKHAGLPWELGVAETHQVLVHNNLRGRIVLQTDGQLKTGRDVAIACLLGAEEFGIATASLVTLGCIMLRKCHLNTCSVGIATQDPELRKRFSGKPEFVINYFYFIVNELREIMAYMGFRTINEMVGRVDRLEPKQAVEYWESRGLDLSGLLYRDEDLEHVSTYCCEIQDHSLENALDHQLIKKSRSALTDGEKVQFSMPIKNANRTVGAMLSGTIAKKFGEDGLPDNTIDINFYGSAGQSFGAFLSKGVSFALHGDANDYVGKGASGGRLVIMPPDDASYLAETSIIIGNVALYGATGGKAFIRGIAGERFCVRNSGATAVVEGVGDHGCEYMTNGRVIVLGSTGRNFAAGMSGGIAYVFDEQSEFKGNCNPELVDLESVDSIQEQTELYEIILEHFQSTGSKNGKRVIENWDQMKKKFVKVYPRDYKRVIEGNSKRNLNGVNRG